MALRWILLLASAGLILVLLRALFVGNIHSNYSATYRKENPGTFWALWFILLLPLAAVLFLALKLHPALRH
jgi:hypothetical protein